MGRIGRIAERRRELQDEVIDSGKHWRILFLGRSANGSTDIVACLIRALRNLGHKVLNLDLERHSGLTENPNNRSAGNGPIYVDYQKVEGVIKKFRPQIIVFGAGGFAFSDEGFKRIRETDIPTLGVTLSDPDVFPTVVEYAGKFDFHTTNAFQALEMYETRGVKNTLYFPFGIDRGYVTQEVAENPSFAADVICIGHASARPERHLVMKRLAREFYVKTYGRGWKIPGSRIIEGLDHIKAARGGRCHINFANTRAGYINVKCGVFETIGSGSLLCTSKFEEMERFFKYGEEIIGWSDEEDLVVQLKEILGDPIKYEAMVERAFMRLASEHLYEHRWLQLFDEIETRLTGICSWLDSERQTRLKRTLGESSERAKKIIVSGFYGARNAGDEFILKSISSALQKIDDSVQVEVAAENPVMVELEHGLQSFKRSSHIAADGHSRTASAVVLGGGGLWHDYTFERAGGVRGFFTGAVVSIAGFGILPLMAKIRDIPFHVIGVGVGPLDNREAKSVVKFLASAAARISVRDAESFDVLQSLISDKKRIFCIPDLVYAADTGYIEVAADIRGMFKSEKILGVNLRAWKNLDTKLITDVANALTPFCRDNDIGILGIPMQEGDNHDRRILGKLIDLLPGDIEALVVQQEVNTCSLLSILKAVDGLVAMRLHACLLAHRLKKGVIGLSYDPKVRRHFEEIGVGNRVLELNSISEKLGPALNDLVNDGFSMSHNSVVLVAEMEDKARKALEVAVSEVVKAGRNDRNSEIPPSAVAHEMQPLAIGRSGSLAAGSKETGMAVKTPMEVPLSPGKIICRYQGEEGVMMPAVENSVPVRLEFPGDAPRRDDRCAWVLNIPSAPVPGIEIELLLINGYERPRNQGWMELKISVNGKSSLKEDIAARKGENRVCVALTPNTPHKVEIELCAVRNCKPWSWHKASMVTISVCAVRKRIVEFTNVMASSPSMIPI